MKKVLKAYMYVTLNKYEDDISFFRKSKNDILEELKDYTHIKIDSWNRGVRPASLHRPKKDIITVQKLTLDKNYFLELLKNTKSVRDYK